MSGISEIIEGCFSEARVEHCQKFFVFRGWRDREWKSCIATVNLHILVDIFLLFFFSVIRIRSLPPSSLSQILVLC